MKADKSLGQHFLTNQKIISDITCAFEDEAEVIIEVGPGPATLTKDLAKIGKDFYLIEKDKRFREILEDIPNIHQIFFTDALKFDWENFLSEHKLKDKKIWLVSNLPYNVSSQLFVQFLQVPQIKYMTLMFQKEVGDKILPRAKKNTASSLMSLGQTYFDVSLQTLVPPGAFNPPPKVDSIVLDFKRKETPEISLELFKKYEAFLRKIFAHRRKQLKAALKSMNFPDLESNFNELDIELTVRAESLNLHNVQNLFKKTL